MPHAHYWLDVKTPSHTRREPIDVKEAHRAHHRLDLIPTHGRIRGYDFCSRWKALGAS